MDAKEILLLSIPEELTQLTLDENYMFQLSESNFEIVHSCFEENRRYNQSKAEKSFEKHTHELDSAEALFEIIKEIAKENSTRTPDDGIKEMVAYILSKQEIFWEKLEQGKTELVDRLAENAGKRYEKSLASKVCRYISGWKYGIEKYAINDSVVRSVLPYYLSFYQIDESRWISGTEKRRIKNFDTMRYSEFIALVQSLSDKAQLSLYQIDQILWYAYRNDEVRKALAPLLAQEAIQ